MTDSEKAEKVHIYGVASIFSYFQTQGVMLKILCDTFSL